MPGKEVLEEWDRPFLKGLWQDGVVGVSKLYLSAQLTYNYPVVLTV
jgi:hypothetical protein